LTPLSQMVAAYPILDDYENLWALDLLLMSQLKYYASAHKGSTTRMAVAALHGTVG
jgi:hypothetical protein